MATFGGSSAIVSSRARLAPWVLGAPCGFGGVALLLSRSRRWPVSFSGVHGMIVMRDCVRARCLGLDGLEPTGYCGMAVLVLSGADGNQCKSIQIIPNLLSILISESACHASNGMDFFMRLVPQGMASYNMVCLNLARLTFARCYSSRLAAIRRG